MNKLNSTDFRRGNLVKYEGEIYRIDSIAEIFPTLDTDTFRIGVVDWNNIEQIPLTEVHFVKNLGAKCPDDGHYEIEADNFKISYGIFDNKIKVNEVEVKICEYLHQLQNLYQSLSGNELPINNMN